VGAQILSDLGLTTIHLLTNHPRKVVGLEGFGIQITAQIPFASAKPNELDEMATAKRRT
jgi:3,4-dihydroxy 2-butanone 4-phosphate synthase/GTP cyclohydrolase II